jgi:surfactin family lipopeptide synthetase A
MSEQTPVERTGLEIAVIGMSGRFPGAKTVHEFWNNLKNGVESISFFSNEELKAAGVPPRLLENSDYVKADGIMEDIEYFDAAFFGYTPKEAEIMDPQIRIFHECVWTALEDAGYDPGTYEGLIGLYAGAAPNLSWEARTFYSGESKEIGYFSAMQLTKKDYLSLRISYKLNLRGPSFVLHTACSTSLVAIHLACQAMISGECDMALAGGITVLRLRRAGYLYQEGMINSADGHCRAFDAQAKGIIGGDGVGVVLLKRLEEALVEGDHIYAVVKGSAINNDGVRKAGFTAPSAKGQAEVIKMVLQVAEVEPESIGYVETHGTATELGDPVEVQGLKMAFNTNKKGFCGIGSVKTNVGHLDAAAGVTSFIKTVLALKHRLIPPGINFQSPNPQIDFIDSPFYINRTLAEWQNGKYPRRAGVSSFGIGGTNAHVILEEFPQGTGGLAPLPDAHAAKKYHLILLSAKTQSLLETMTQNLADYFKNNPDINLADAAYTLQVGRKAFNHRWMALCSSPDEAIEALTLPGAGETETISPEGENSVVRRVEPVADGDSLADIGRLWLQGEMIDWKAFYSREKRYRIPLPTYPFEKQRYWPDAAMEMTAPPRPMENFQGTTDADMGNWFYLPSWKRSLPDPYGQKNKKPDRQYRCRWLVFVNELKLGNLLVKRLIGEEQDVIMVKKGETFTRLENNDTLCPCFTIKPGEAGHYHDLFAQLSTKNHLPDRILHLWNVTGEKEIPLNVKSFDETQSSGFYSLLFIAKTIAEGDIGKDVHIFLLTDHLQEVLGSEPLCPGKAPVLGLVKAIPQEYPGISCKSIDILLPEPGSGEETSLVDTLLEELMFPGRSACTGPVVALRNNQWWEEVFEPLPLLPPGEVVEAGESPGDSPGLGLREKGVYLITGGLGQIGLVFAELLVKRVGARLILTGRSGFPAREQWDQWLETHEPTDPTAVKIKRLQALEEMGGSLLYIQADAANRRQVQNVVIRAEKTFGKINGVIHSAGIITGPSMRTIRELSREDCQLQFQGKAYGTMILAELFKDKKPDFFWMLSSISCVLAGLGFGAYASANLFMDVFAKKQERLHSAGSLVPRWFSLNWDGMEDRKTTIAFERLFLLKNTTIHQLVFSVGGNLQARIDRWIKLETVRGRGDSHTPVKKTSSHHPRPDLSTAYTAPRNSTEAAVAGVWQGLLGYDEIGIYDDFLEVGGDSLKAITLISRIHRELDVMVPLVEFFNQPTVEAIARYILSSAKKLKKNHISIEPAEKKEFYTVSSAQKRLYTLHQMEPEIVSYNMSYVSVIQEWGDKNRLEKVFAKLINRHENLRTSFQVMDDKPVQQIHETVEFQIQYYKAESEVKIEGTIEDFIRPFDLSQAPLLRVGIIKTGETDSGDILMVDMHHIVSDGVSLDIFAGDFTRFYIFAHEEKDFPRLRLQYKDFSEWQISEREKGAAKKQEEYWLREFQGEMPILNMPTDYPRPALQSFEGGLIDFGIGGEETTALSQIARSNGVTLFMVLLAVYYIFLSKLSSQENIIVGTPVVGRRHTDLEQIMGVFVNTLALRSTPAGEKTVKDFLNQVRARTLEAFENQDYQFEDLVDKVAVERDMSRNPLFDVTFVLNYELESTKEMWQEKTKDQGLKIRPYRYTPGTAKFDLTLEVYDVGKNLQFTFEYCKKLFKKETIHRLIRYFKAVISSVIENPEREILEIEVITGNEKQQLLHHFNDTAAKYPAHKTVHRLFAEQVEQTPDNIALVGKEEEWQGRRVEGQNISITYRELNQRAGQLACFLIEKGVKQDTIVGIMMERSLEMIAGILGILQAGGAYLPIDPDYPEARIQYMLKDSGAKILVTSPGSWVNFEKMSIVNCQLLMVNEMQPDRRRLNNPPQDVSSHLHLSPAPVTSLAYIIYTSGTTGRPKGAMIEHRNVVRLLFNDKFPFDFNDVDVWTLFHSCSFDFSVWEMYGALLYGGQLVVIPKLAAVDTQWFWEILKKTQTTILNQTPSAFYHLMNLELTDPKRELNIRYIIFGGEALTPARLQGWKVKYPGTKLINMYGITETTVHVTFKEITGNEIELNMNNIGKPIPNLTTYILDENLKLLPVGVTGELFIGGKGVGRGYLNRPELTNKRFVRDPYDPGKRLYRSGDLAKLMDNGEFLYSGRIDHQVKIRGFRVELGEIELQLLSHNKIREAVVVAKENERSEKNLCAYIVTNEVMAASELRNYLAGKLPDYMIPPYFVHLDRIPLTHSGKIDRNALPSPGIKTGEGYIPPENETQEKMVDIWAEVLGLEKNLISIDADFFEIGGHSLKATRMAAIIHKEFNIKVPLVKLFQTPTIKGIASLVNITLWLENKKTTINREIGEMEEIVI